MDHNFENLYQMIKTKFETIPLTSQSLGDDTSSNLSIVQFIQKNLERFDEISKLTDINQKLGEDLRNAYMQKKMLKHS
jgi:hypothetical protein